MEGFRAADGDHQTLLGLSSHWRKLAADGPIWRETVDRQVALLGLLRLKLILPVKARCFAHPNSSLRSYPYD